MKKILLLGGSEQQIAAIDTAKQLGYYTILCDYLPDNPGQYHADRFYFVSTTDKETVLKLAEEERIDGILAYASDPAAPTAAYVAEKLGLPGNPYRSVEILCYKDLFRNFLRENGFHTPKAKGYADIDEAENDLVKGLFTFPIVVKPADSSGSKGVSLVNRSDKYSTKLEYAMSFSRVKRIIVEEYVDKFGYQIAGDGLSVDGTLIFRCFANDHFNPECANPFVPVSASFPNNMPEWVQNKVHNEIQRLITLLEMKTCTYNFDVRIDTDYNVYLMEIAPRDGGNYIPQVIRYATGLDLVKISVKAAMGDEISIDASKHTPNGYYSYYSVHSLKDGILDRVAMDNEAKKHVLESHILRKSGDEVKSYTCSNKTLGCLLMKFDTMEQMLNMMDYSDSWIKVVLQ